MCTCLLCPSMAAAKQIPNRGLFVSMIEEPYALSDQKHARQLIDFAKKSHIRTLFVQIYRSGDFHPSCSRRPNDAFARFIHDAHGAGIRVHAWMNLMSLGGNEKAPILQKYGPDILTRNTSKKENLLEYKIDNQYFLEPGDPRVRKETVATVSEVLRAYPDLDGIQFDYLRYPDSHPFYGHTRVNLENYLKTTGHSAVETDPAWKNWKRAQVTELLKELIRKTRMIRPKIQISTTGALPYVRAYHEAFQDWPSWLNSKLVEFVTVMDYSPDPAEFHKFLSDAKTRITTPRKMNVAVGAYKLVHSPEIFEKEFRICESARCGQCVAFYYGSFLENPALSAALMVSSDYHGK